MRDPHTDRDRPIDRLQTPAIVDGYCDERLDRASIAASLLSPRYFDPGGDTATSECAIGVTIAREPINDVDARGTQVRRQRQRPPPVETAGAADCQSRLSI